MVPGTPGTVPIHYPVGGVLSVASRAASHGSVASEAVSGRCRLEQLRRKASPLAGLELGSVSGRKLCRWRRFQSTPDISLLGNWHQNIRWSLPLGKMTLCSDCFVVRAKNLFLQLMYMSIVIQKARSPTARPKARFFGPAQARPGTC